MVFDQKYTPHSQRRPNGHVKKGSTKRGNKKRGLRDRPVGSLDVEDASDDDDEEDDWPFAAADLLL